MHCHRGLRHHRELRSVTAGLPLTVPMEDRQSTAQVMKSNNSIANYSTTTTVLYNGELCLFIFRLTVHPFWFWESFEG